MRAAATIPPKMTGATRLRAVLYVRRSYDDDQQSGLETQVAALEAHAERQGYEVVDLVIDDDVSGALLFRDRPEGKKVLDLVAAEAIDILLVDKVDRFGRSNLPNLALMQALPDFGVTLEFLDYGKVEKDSPAEEMVKNRSAWAEEERKHIRNRTMRGKNHFIGNGSRIVSPNLKLLGYTYNRRTPETPAHYTVNDAEALIVREIFERFVVDGDSRRTIAQDMDKKHKGLRYWRTQTITTILTHQAYVGRYYQGRFHTWEFHKKVEAEDIGTRVRGKGKQRETLKPKADWGAAVTIPALIDDETFRLAQERLTNEDFTCRGTKSPLTGESTAPEHLSPLRGKVICGTCGSKMWINRAEKRTFYHCPFSSASGYYAREKGREICKGRTMNVDKVERLVWRSLDEMLDPKKLAQRLKAHAKQAPKADDPKKLRAEMAKAETKADACRRAIITAHKRELMGEIDKATLTGLLEDLGKDVETQETIRRHAKERLDTLDRDVSDLEELIGLDDAEARQIMLLKVVREVVIRPTRVEVAGAFLEGHIKLLMGIRQPLVSKTRPDEGPPTPDWYESEPMAQPDAVHHMTPEEAGSAKPFELDGLGEPVKQYWESDEKNGENVVAHAMTNPLYFRIAQPV